MGAEHCRRQGSPQRDRTQTTLCLPASISRTSGSLPTRTRRLEYLRTQDLIRRYLPPPPARVLDVGGGPGAHARSIAEDRHHAHLVDPVAHHVQAASAPLYETRDLNDALELAESQGISQTRIAIRGEATYPWTLDRWIADRLNLAVIGTTVVRAAFV